MGTDEELVFAKKDGNGLDPSEVPLHVLVAPANEVSVDVEVGVGQEAEVMVFLAVEVKGDAISTYKTGVLAYCSWLITFCTI